MKFRRRGCTNGAAFALIFGLIFAAAGVLSGVIFGQKTTLDCRRVESNRVDCSLRRDLLGFPMSARELPQMQGAWVDVSSDSEGDTYAVMLQNSGEDTMLTGFYSSSRAPKEETAATINQFIADPSQSTLQLEQAEYWVFILMAAFVLIGLIAIAWGVLSGLMGLARRLSLGRAV